MKRAILLLIAGAVVGVLVTVAALHRAGPAEEEKPPAAPQRVSVVDGEPTITLDDKTQREIGIVTARVAQSTHAEEMELFGTVVDVQELAALQNQAVAARAQLEQANAKAAFDRAELQRLRTLNADNRNVSDRAVQEAAANVAADEGAAASANASMRAAGSTIVQRFGPAVVPLIPDLVAMRKVLVQITMPMGVAAPQSLRIRDLDARLLSAAPRVDAKLQGTPYLYVAPGGTLAAGMNVTARYAGARGVAVAAVPPEAIVSWEGRSWVYVRRSATQFSRREASVVQPGADVVTSGAQQLLSEEMRAELHEE
jgi:multidrug efflux system membrane fusion protein